MCYSRFLIPLYLRNRNEKGSNEIRELLDCLIRGDVEGILHKFAELKIVMCVVKRHLPEGVTM